MPQIFDEGQIDNHHQRGKTELGCQAEEFTIIQGLLEAAQNTNADDPADTPNLADDSAAADPARTPPPPCPPRKIQSDDEWRVDGLSRATTKKLKRSLHSNFALTRRITTTPVVIGT